MNDLEPDKILDSGFKLIDSIVNSCAAEGIYTIIDLHTFPGGQSMQLQCLIRPYVLTVSYTHLTLPTKRIV